jgi:hypothetical protein
MSERVGLALLGRELAQRLPDDLLEGRDGMRNSPERASAFTFAEAHTDDGLKRFRVHVGDRGSDRTAVRRAVSVSELELGGRSASHDERPVMRSAVMRDAKRDEIVHQVFSAFAPSHEVMRLRKSRVPAPGDATFPAVSA